MIILSALLIAALILMTLYMAGTVVDELGLFQSPGPHEPLKLPVPKWVVYLLIFSVWPVLYLIVALWQLC